MIFSLYAGAECVVFNDLLNTYKPGKILGISSNENYPIIVETEDLYVYRFSICGSACLNSEYVKLCNNEIISESWETFTGNTKILSSPLDSHKMEVKVLLKKFLNGRLEIVKSYCPNPTAYKVTYLPGHHIYNSESGDKINCKMLADDTKNNKYPILVETDSSNLYRFTASGEECKEIPTFVLRYNREDNPIGSEYIEFKNSSGDTFVGLIDTYCKDYYNYVKEIREIFNIRISCARNN